MKEILLLSAIMQGSCIRSVPLECGRLWWCLAHPEWHWYIGCLWYSRPKQCRMTVILTVIGGDDHHLNAEQTDTSCNVSVHLNDYQLLYFADCLSAIYLICKSLCMYIVVLYPLLYILLVLGIGMNVSGICTGEWCVGFHSGISFCDLTPVET